MKVPAGQSGFHQELWGRAANLGSAVVFRVTRPISYEMTDATGRTAFNLFFQNDKGTQLLTFSTDFLKRKIPVLEGTYKEQGNKETYKSQSSSPNYIFVKSE